MRYFSMFSGIGTGEKGIEQAFNDKSNGSAEESDSRSGGNSIRYSIKRRQGRTKSCCVGFCEIDRHAEAIYRHHYPDHRNYGDATRIVPDELPDFDFLISGFPCQSFSIAGKRQGFNDTRGTLFFEIARILSHKRPTHFLLENVRGLLSHDGGKTLHTILGVLSELGYFVELTVLNSKDFGVPQNRERCFFIGHLRERCEREILSIGNGDGESFAERGGVDVAYCLDANYFKGCNDAGRNRRTIVDGAGKVTVGTLRTHKDGEGFRRMESGVAPTIPARARNDGSGQLVIAVPVLTPDRPTKRQNGRRFKEDGEEAFTLTAQDRHGVMIEMQTANCVTPDAYLTRGERNRDENGKAVLTSMHDRRIRRLTPIECERLQGLPDGYTALGRYGDEIRKVADTNRYKGLGNAFTVNVIEAIIRAMRERGCLE